MTTESQELQKIKFWSSFFIEQGGTMKVKKEYAELVKDTLVSYKLLEGHKEFLKEQLEELKTNGGMKGVDYGIKVQTSNINKLTENTALQNIDNEKEIIQEIQECDRKIRIIESAISKLDDLSVQIINLRFKGRMPWIELSYEANYSERHCKHKYKEALDNLAIVFYGDKAIDKTLKSKVS